MTKFAGKEEVLALFRRCLRSARSIRDAEKKQMYESVARDYFRKNMTLPVGSREAYNAYRDGIDQVESMEYYQSMAMCARGGQATTIPRPSVAPVNAANPFSTECQREEVMGWIRLHLPLIRQPDLDNYSRRLIEDGFDSIQFIEQELTLDDVEFMKKAHRRVIARSFAARSEEGQ